MVAVKRPTSARKYPVRRKVYNKKPKVSFAAKVNQIIARNNENKYTSTKLYKAPVATITDTAVISGNVQQYDGYAWAPGSTPVGLFNISQGTSVQERIGNKIKLKRWVIKGLIQPNDTFINTPPTFSSLTTTGIAPNTLAGYVTIYFGKYQVNSSPIKTTPITNFYQSGATDITPEGKQVETLYRVNKDLYKIYFSRRFKMGAGTTSDSVATGSPRASVPQSNDFGLTRSFGFDVTKYILKNKTLLYDELVTTPQNPDIEFLTLFAVFHPAAGDMGFVPAQLTTPLFSPTINNSFYNISAMSYAEYEDA